MRKGIFHSGLLAAAAFALFPHASALAGEVGHISLSNGATGTRAEIQLNGRGGFNTLSLAGPDRLVVDLPDSSAARGLRLPAGTGIVKAVRTGQPVPGTLRIVFDLSGPVTALKPRIEPSGANSRLVIEWPGDGPVTAAATATPPASPLPAHVATEPKPAPAADQHPAANVAVSPPPSSFQNVGIGGAPLSVLEVRGNAAAAAPVPASTTPAASETMATNTNANTAEVAAPASAPLASAAMVANETAASEPTESTPPVPLPAPSIAMRAGMRPLVVAIDPGHGGQDPGAIGPTGKREKDVTLAMARELARQVNATPGLRAYLTRDSDVFIPLPMRAKRARAAKADIFVSIHADAAENRNASGSSVYVLSLKGASSQRARWLADKENAADMIGGVQFKQADNTLASVLLDLAQSGHMKASEDAANHVLDGLKRVGNNHKPNIERANFAVLRTSDMPAMLVETAFISNRDEERRLTDPGYQRKVAGAVLNGISTYFTRQPPPGTLFAARAQAEALATTAGGGTP